MKHYERLDRIEAVRNLLKAVETACNRIVNAPVKGLDAPTPYPSLSRFGFQWIKEGSYWFAYTNTPPGLVIAGVFYDAADIPNRM